MTRYILALDQGTTSSRAILFDHAGQVAGMAQREFAQHFPQPGWVEHDAEVIWQSQLAVAREVLAAQHVPATEIQAIGIANQRETVVLWDRATGMALGPAIVWQDRRTADACDALRADGHAPMIQARTGLVPDAYFSATKLQWLLDHIPDARRRAEQGELAAGTIDTWLLYKLAGVHLTDTSNASRTMLMNLATLQWDPDLLALFDIPLAVLPEIVSSSGLACYARAEWFGATIAVAGIAGDQQAATFGQACLHPGMAKNTYGTGCFMLLHAGREPAVSHNNLLSTVGWTIGSGAGATTDYLLEGSVFMAGATIQWLRDGLGIIENAPQVEQLAATVPDTGGVVLVPAFTGLGAPYWDPHARGIIVGLSRGSHRGHIARAALESIAYQSCDVLDAMQKDATVALHELRVDGGAAANNLLMQFQADMLGVPVVRPAVTETTALGVAYLAGLATGFWADLAEIAGQWRQERCFIPTMGEDERAARLYHWRQALDRARDWHA